METLTKNEIRICPRCKSSELIRQGNCTVCGTPVYAVRGTNGRWNPASIMKDSPATVAVYSTSALTFLLGIMEGFVDNNSQAMTLNLIVSLVVLSLATRADKNPVAIPAMCLLIIVASQLLSPVFDLAVIQHWLGIKFFLAAIPLTALILWFRKRLGS